MSSEEIAVRAMMVIASIQWVVFLFWMSVKK